ncbi:hypothetical protein NFI96_019920, partial [Prochilodus magdalenae]
RSDSRLILILSVFKFKPSFTSALCEGDLDPKCYAENLINLGKSSKSIKDQINHQGAETQSSTYENNDIQLSLRQVSASAKAAIHLSARYNSKYTQSVEWRDNEGQSFKQGGLSLVHNKIRIPHNGFYFVYSQASYRVNCSSGSEEGQDMPIVYLSHMVQRWSSSYDNEKPLLNAVRTACKLAPLSPEEEEVEPWFTAIYVGAVFKLQAGDLLYTEMSKDRLREVETEGGKTFFGVFAL